MEPTISLSIQFIFLFLFLTPSKRKFIISLVKYLNKEKIVVGKVILDKAIGICILYIGKIRLVINRPERGKE